MIIWSNKGSVYWRIYASFGLNKLNKRRLKVDYIICKYSYK